jgi:hypothetical protein
VPAINAEIFYSKSEAVPLGTLLMRETRCDPTKLVCTGKNIPSIPSTCVRQRKLDQKGYDRPTRDNMYKWAKRMIRMGARDNFNATGDRTPSTTQNSQGNTRKEVQAGVNFILSTLWNQDCWGPFEPVEVEATFNESCCESPSYTKALSPFQSKRTGAFWRNVLHPHDGPQGNAPPCVWCQRDGAYNDENPA